MAAMMEMAVLEQATSVMVGVGEMALETVEGVMVEVGKELEAVEEAMEAV